MTMTPRLKLPFLAVAQAQKEITHNEALQILDCVAAPSVEEGATNDPPATPYLGQSHIVGDAPTGIFAGKSGQLACYTSGGWRFVDAPVGMRVHVKDAGLTATRETSGWEVGSLRADAVIIGGTQVLSSRSAAIASPTGGTGADTVARATIEQILVALRHHGLIDS